MKNSKELIAKAGILPRLKLGIKTAKGVQSTGRHVVKLIEDKIVVENDPRTGQKVEKVKYTLEENGEQKEYKTKLRGADNLPSYLVQAIAEYKEGDTVVLEMKKNGPKNYVEVSPVGSPNSAEITDEDDADIESTE